MEEPKEIDLAPGQNLYRKVRAGFVLKNSSLHAWCRDNGVLRPNATSALLGGWTGPKAKALVTRIVKAAGVANDR